MTGSTDRTPAGHFLTVSPEPADIFTAEDLNEEQEDIGRTIDEFWENEVEPALPAIQRLEPGAARRVLEKGAGLGLMALAIPERYGGLELDLTTTLVVAERVARDASYMVWEGGHTMLGTLPIVYFGTPEQKERFLPKMATLEKLGAYALSETQSGSDALNVRTRADLSADGTHYVLNGQKMWITNGSDADLFVTFAAVAGTDFTCFLVERDFPGVSFGANEHKMGLRGSSTTAFYLDDVRVPVENVLGEVGKGHRVAFNILNLGRLKLGASTVGAAKDILGISIRYAKQRRAFGSPIADFGAIRHKLAEMAIRIFATEAIAWRTAGMIERRAAGVTWDDPDAADRKLTAVRASAAECSIVKVFGTEMLDYVVDEGVQIHGGYGYHEDYKVERAYRDARINRIFEGTNEINRLLIPRMLMKEDPLPPPTQIDLSESSFEDRLVSSAKHLSRWAIGLARTSLGDRLDTEQEVLMHLADMMIETYTMESVWLRTQKIEASGRNSLALPIARVYLYGAAGRLAGSAREVLGRCLEGSPGVEQLNLIAKLTDVEPIDVVGLRREIAEKLVDHERYVI
jgi:alkylation response protein AidB-like acyl-CoA dehydrogenase